MPEPATEAAVLVEDALVAYRALAELGEQIEDEWQYVTDLVELWTADLRALASTDSRPVDAASHEAVATLIDEVGRITDPHRAIDWLSTYPQVLRLTLERRP